MKNVKGQALVEFIIIAPIFIMMIMAVIDIGNVIYKKYNLENDLDYIVDLYRDNKITEINNYSANYDFGVYINGNDEFITIELSKEVAIYTPILNIIMGNPYEITVDRVIYVE